MKKIVMYGSKLCEDTCEAQEVFAKNNIEYTYLDITEDLENLAKFLRHRDSNPIYKEKRENGGIGIPCIEVNDGEKLFLGLDEETLNSLK